MHERVLQYDRACYKLAMKFAGSLSVDDLFQEARIAASHALYKFKSDRGANELTWVYLCVTRSLLSCLRVQHRYNDRYVHNGTLPEEGYTEELPHCIDVNQLLSCLTDKERYVLKKRMNGMTCRKIGSEFNISRQRIQQIQTRAIAKLKEQVQHAHPNSH